MAAGGAPGAQGAAAPAAATGVATQPKGLPSGVLDSKWLNDPVTGYAALGLGTALAEPTPDETCKAQCMYGQKAEDARGQRIARNHRRVPAPSVRGPMRRRVA